MSAWIDIKDEKPKQGEIIYYKDAKGKAWKTIYGQNPSENNLITCWQRPITEEALNEHWRKQGVRTIKIDPILTREGKQ